MIDMVRMKYLKSEKYNAQMPNLPSIDILSDTFCVIDMTVIQKIHVKYFMLNKIAAQ